MGRQKIFCRVEADRSVQTESLKLLYTQESSLVHSPSMPLLVSLFVCLFICLSVAASPTPHHQHLSHPSPPTPPSVYFCLSLSLSLCAHTLSHTHTHTQTHTQTHTHTHTHTTHTHIHTRARARASTLSHTSEFFHSPTPPPALLVSLLYPFLTTQWHRGVVVLFTF